ncbi:MAG: toxin-antitoxin system HicB family antitoxin [Legionellaceae bacterium]|nr:toxin-antitoxin system HicB family antitoxin [Legionellaceae bacterium]
MSQYFIYALVSLEWETAKEIDAAFKEAVDDYLNSCVARGIEPDTPFKGSLNVRIGRERHEKAAPLVRETGCKSLNSLINQALDHEFERLQRIA